jgi:hypothetical protein
MYGQLAGQSIRHPVENVEDIPVTIRISSVPVDFAVLEMGVCRQTPLMLGEATPEHQPRLMESFDHYAQHQHGRRDIRAKPKGTEQCYQVRFTKGPERNTMTLDKKPSATEDFLSTEIT